MTKPRAGGRRPIDRVLDPAFLGDLEEISLADLRVRRREAEQEEADLSYVRRLLQGRMDIVRAEQLRRSPAGDGSTLIEDLSEILADGNRTTRGLGRHMSIEPTRVGDTRRREEQLASDSALSDVGALSDEALAAGLESLQQQEAEVSATRREVQQVVDHLSGELTRRYREGIAHVEELLETDSR